MIIKRIIVLNEVTGGYGSGIVRGMVNLEKNGPQVKCSLTVFNLKDLSGGEFLFGLTSGVYKAQIKRVGSAGKLSYTFMLDPATDPDLKLTVCIAHMFMGKLIPVLYGANHGAKIWDCAILEKMMSAVNSQALDNRAQKENTRTDPQPGKLNTFKIDREKPEVKIVPKQSDYDDARIADINYYPDALTEAAASAARPKIPELKPIAEDNNKISTPKPEHRTETIFHKKTPAQSDAGGRNDYKKTDEAASIDMPYVSTWGGYESVETPKQPIKKDYYDTIKDNLDKLFKQNPPETALNRALKGTRWARIMFNDTQYYIVGVIGDTPDYIGYGVPGKYSVNPPSELAGYCQWIPLNEHEPKGAGYWMMYQSAKSGESVMLDLI